MRHSSDIVEEVVTRGYIDNALRLYGVHASYADDLRQEVVLTLLNLDAARLNDIAEDSKLSAFVTRIVRNQWCSTTSDFYRKYRKNEHISYTPEVWNIADEV